MALLRTSQNSTQTLGVMLGAGAGVISGSIERPGPTPTRTQRNIRLPEGSYQLSPYSAPKNGDVMRLYSNIISKDIAYLIHPGFDVSHSKGCIIPFKPGLVGNLNKDFGRGIVNQIRQGGYKSLNIFDGF